MNDHVVLCGFGQVGYRVFLLLKRLDQKVAVISAETLSEWKAEVEQSGNQFIPGDARDDHLLEQASIKNAKAVIAATDNDLVNLSIAMDAKRLNPRATIVTRLFDQDLAPNVEQALGVHKALSMSAIAAPVFASTSLGENTVSYFDLDQTPFLITEYKDGHKTDANEQWSAIAERDHIVPLFSFESNKCEPVRDLGTHPSENATHLVLKRPSQKTIQEFKNPVGKGLKVLLAGLSGLSSSIKAILGLFLLVMTTSVFVVHFSMQHSWLDSFYFVMTTITTVGYGDINFLSAPPLVKLYGCLSVVR